MAHVLQEGVIVARTIRCQWVDSWTGERVDCLTDHVPCLFTALAVTFRPLTFFVSYTRSFSFHSHSLLSAKNFRGGAAMNDPFWEDQPGSTNSNWFKDHPKVTLLLLTGVILILVVVSI